MFYKTKTCQSTSCHPFCFTFSGFKFCPAFMLSSSSKNSSPVSPVAIGSGKTPPSNHRLSPALPLSHRPIRKLLPLRARPHNHRMTCPDWLSSGSPVADLQPRLPLVHRVHFLLPLPLSQAPQDLARNLPSQSSPGPSPPGSSPGS